MRRYDLSNRENRVLPRVLQWQARESPDADFLIREDRRVTFAEANRLSDAYATWLEGRGVQSGDRIGLHLSGRPETVLLALAVNKLGALWVPINNDYKGEWLLDTIARSRCRVVFTEARLAPHVAAIRESLAGEILVLLEGEDGSSAELPGAIPFSEVEATEGHPFDVSGQNYGDVCAILWTSGTTGRSKAVRQSYNTWLRGIHRVGVPHHQSRPGDVVYNVLPLFNTGAWVTAIFRAMVEGLPCVLDEPFSVTHFWDRIRKFGATQTFTLGAMHMFLWNAPERPDDADNPLRVAKMVPMPAEIEGPFQKRFGLELLGSGYGQSECPMILTAREMGLPPGTLGRPAEDTDIRLFDDDDREVPDGEVGEIRIRPLEPHILFKGYFDDEEATRNAFRGPNREWYCTGDLGRRDGETGLISFVDRKKDAVRFAGRNISTLQVEGVFRRHAAVKDVAAFGIPAPGLEAEDELKVDVILEPGAEVSFEELASFVNDNAPYYFVPRYMEFVSEIPYTPTGKAQKFKLREKGVSEGVWDRRSSGYVVRR